MTRVGRGPALAGVVAVVGVVAAAWVWLGADADRSPSTSLPVVESHGLDPDQAACLAFGLVIRHSDAVDLTLQLGKYQGLDPDAGLDLAREVADLVQIAPEHPVADIQLAKAFNDVAVEGLAVVAATDIPAYRSAVTGRSAEIAESEQACLEVAEFDVKALSIRQSGLS